MIKTQIHSDHCTDLEELHGKVIHHLGVCLLEMVEGLIPSLDQSVTDALRCGHKGLWSLKLVW